MFWATIGKWNGITGSCSKTVMTCWVVNRQVSISKDLLDPLNKIWSPKPCGPETWVLPQAGSGPWANPTSLAMLHLFNCTMALSYLHFPTLLWGYGEVFQRNGKLVSLYGFKEARLSPPSAFSSALEQMRLAEGGRSWCSHPLFHCSHQRHCSWLECAIAALLSHSHPWLINKSLH